MSRLDTPLTRMALAVGSLLFAFSGGAAADAVLSASTIAGAGSSSATPSTNSYPGYESSYASISNTLGVSNAYAFANSSGAYAVRSSAAGVANSRAFASFGQLLTNTSGVAQHYTMSFHIYGGYMSTFLNGGVVLTGTEFLTSTYLAEISVNGNNVFRSEATIRRDALGTSGSKTGTDLNVGDDVADGNYGWGGGYYTVDLGTVADGGIINVLASLSDESASNVGTYEFDGGGSGYGYGCYGQVGVAGGGRDDNATAAYGGGTCFKGQTEAFYGDPIDFFSSSDTTSGPTGGSVTISATAVNDVPEPGMAGLAVLALGAAGWAGRRRRA